MMREIQDAVCDSENASEDDACAIANIDGVVSDAEMAEPEIKSAIMSATKTAAKSAAKSVAKSVTK